MEKKYSVAEARQNLPALVHEAERAGTVGITRRGRIVARLLGEHEYRRLTRAGRGIDWGSTAVDTRGFRFDREQANARG